MKKKKLKKRIKRLEDICEHATSHYWDAHKDFEKLKVDFETTKRTVKDDLVEHNVNQIKKYDFKIRDLEYRLNDLDRRIGILMTRTATDYSSVSKETKNENDEV